MREIRLLHRDGRVARDFSGPDGSRLEYQANPASKGMLSTKGRARGKSRKVMRVVPRLSK
jgi:hypothetical protein